MTANARIWAGDSAAGTVNVPPPFVWMTVPGGGPIDCPPQVTFGGGPFSPAPPWKLKSQMTSSACAAAQLSRAGCDRPTGTFTPS